MVQYEANKTYDPEILTRRLGIGVLGRCNLRGVDLFGVTNVLKGEKRACPMLVRKH
jgi:hypothetical protein